MEGYDSATYGERWAEVYDDWYDDPDGSEDCVRRLAQIAGDAEHASPILELGVGTGRIALRLAARGYPVVGIESSPAMVARLRAKEGGADLPVALGDLADVEPPDRTPTGTGRFGLVYATANTFFGLVDDGAQQRCLRRLASWLEPGGRLVLEVFVPASDIDEHTSRVSVRSLDLDRVVLTADRHDRASQTIEGQFVDISEHGIRLRPFIVRYLRPEQLDALAGDCGLTLVERWASWRGDAFTDESTNHVSVYARADSG